MMELNGLTSIPRIVRDGAAKWPDRVAFDFSGDIYSFAEIDRLSNRFANGLKALGVSRGDRVCSMLDNSIDQAMLWFGLSKLGAISVPLNTALKGEFLRHQLADSGATMAVTEAHYVERFRAVENDLSQLDRLFIRRGAADDGVMARLATSDFAAVCSENDAPIDVEIGPDDPALIIYTSGTTGPSKGCLLGHGYACNAGLRFAQGASIRDGDRFWTPLPMFHLAATGFTLGCFQLGASASIHSSFSVTNFWPEIERSRATVACVISIMLVLLADAPDNEAARRCHGQLRAVAGVPFPRALQDTWKRRFGVQHTGASGFGMTEAGPMTFAPVTSEVPDNSSGRRYGDYDVQVVDDGDNVLPPGAVGELVARPLRPGIMFQGYWGRPEATVEVLRNAWFHTGDLGRFDENGFFFFVDRKKDYLRKGGENISSFELEAALRAHPEIEDVAAHAALVPGSEDEVMVSVVLRDGGVLDAESLCRWSIDRVPRHAVPRFIAFCDGLPRNASGRVLKYELRARGITAETWDRAASQLAPERRTVKAG